MKYLKIIFNMVDKLWKIIGNKNISEELIERIKKMKNEKIMKKWKLVRKKNFEQEE